MLRRTGVALLGASAGRMRATRGGARGHAGARRTHGELADSVAINTIWVVVAALLVIFMQAGFAFLEIGFSRGEERRHGRREDPHELLDRRRSCTGRAASPSPSAAATSSAHDGFFLRDYGDPQTAFPVMGLSDATIETKWLFQFSFCAVSLAIVWGTTLERIKFGVYIIYAVDLRRR